MKKITRTKPQPKPPQRRKKKENPSHTLREPKDSQPSTPYDNFKSVKVSLKHVLMNPENNTCKILETVTKAHRIVIHTLQFMKLWLLDQHQNGRHLSTVDSEFVSCCLKTVCDSANWRPRKPAIIALKEELCNFYNSNYKALCVEEDLNYSGMGNVLAYLATDVVTMYENNIKQHYVKYVGRFVNVIFEKKEHIELLKSENNSIDARSKIRLFKNHLRHVKNDLLNVKDSSLTSDSVYHQWIKDNRKVVIPVKQSFQKDCINYDLECHPQDYLPSMINMMKEVEAADCSVYNVFPLRTSIVPKHIRLDTATLVQTMFTKEHGSKEEYLTKGNLKHREDDIWAFFFKTEKKCFFKKSYSFHHMIETDGVSVCILFRRKGDVGKRVVKKKTSVDEPYIDDLADYSSLVDKKIVAIDPNWSDLLFCVDGDTSKRKKYRHTKNQRRKETKSKKYAQIILCKKNELINGKTVTELETELSVFNRKTLVIDEFKKYVKKKNQMNFDLFPFYQRYLFRKLRLNGYWNRLRCDQRMINSFAKKFGKAEDVVVCIGDYEQRENKKFCEPIKGKGFRALFRRYGYRLFLVDEFRTSCRCSACGGKCSTFRKRRNPKPMRSNIITVHGVLKCETCGALWNRDDNAARNIYKIAFNAIHGETRPEYLQRSQKNSGAPSVGDVHSPSVKRRRITDPSFTCQR